jgi:formamidopyrimidine-DNA glycosylase
MPELPEVESARLRMERVLKGQVIAQARPDVHDRIVFDRASPRAVQRALVGAKVLGSGRKGKYFWLVLDRRPWPVFHLGMTGNVEIRGTTGMEKAWGGDKRWGSRHAPAATGKAPRFCRLLLVTEKGAEVAITDPRRFGRIRLAQDPAREVPISKLGFDPLEECPPVAELKRILNPRRAPIKSVLLDQAIFAGVGNWIADEVLFQARISPHRLASTLTTPEVRRLRTRLLGIIRKAVSVQADYERFPGSWLFHDRWGKKKEAYHSRGHAIRHDTIGGRTTAWVPELQN